MAGAGVGLWLTAPMAAIFVILYSPLLIYGIATLVLANTLTRLVVVVRPDAHMVCVDEQRWWRDDEVKIPDAARREYKGKRVAFLHHVYEAKEGATTPEFTGLAVFDPWSEPLEFKDDSASAGLVAGIKATAKAAATVASHREPDRREVVRYGMLVAVIITGLVCAYFAAGMVRNG